MLPVPGKPAGLDGLFNWAKRVASEVLLGGRLIEGVEASTSALLVDHKLGRTPRGAIVVKSDISASLNAYAFTDTTITVIAASGSPVVSLYVF